MTEVPRRPPPPPPLPPPPLPPPQDPRRLGGPQQQGWQSPPLHYPAAQPPHGGQAWPPAQAPYAPHPYGQYRPPPGQPDQQGWPPPVQQPWGYGGWGAQPPSRRTSGVARALVGLVGLLAAAVFVLVIVAAFAGGEEADPFVRDAGSSDPAEPSNPDTRPVDPADFRAVLERNTLYEQGGMATGNCEATELGDADTSEQQRYYDRLMSCLDTEWRPLITSAGYRYGTPQLVVFDAPVSTPCGSAAPQDGRTLAFYCPTDSVLYADAPQMQRFFGTVEMAYAVVIGHEFGHHVQNETGVLVAYDDAVYARFGDRFELSRRVELQASCMSGLFLGAVAASYPIDDRKFADLSQVALSFGDEPGASDDERDHGSGRSNREWILGAFNDNDTARCNTFIAPGDEVD